MTEDEPFHVIEAATAVRELHHAMADLHPEQNLWKIEIALSTYPMPMIALAWNTEHQQLMSAMVYMTILRAIGGSDADHQRITALLRRAVRASRAADAPSTSEVIVLSPQTLGASERALDQILADLDLAGDAEHATSIRNAMRTIDSVKLTELPDVLTAITTEQQFMDYLRKLRTAAGISLRDLEKEMERVNPRGMLSKSSLSSLFQGNTVPQEEVRVRTLLTVLLAHTESTREHGQTAAGAVNDHLLLWRRLRNKCALTDSPSPQEQAIVEPLRDVVLQDVSVVPDIGVSPDLPPTKKVDCSRRVIPLTIATVMILTVIGGALVLAGYLLRLLVAA